jgi:hypothetical protein
MALARAHAVRVESTAITLASCAFAGGALTALLVFHGTFTPLWGPRSVGVLAIAVGAVCGLVAFALGAAGSYARIARSTGRMPSLPRRIWDTVALAFTHLAIYAMLCLVAFNILQDAFTGLEVDTLTGAMLVGLAAAAAGYFLYLSASSTTATRLSTLLAIFLCSGVLLSMVTSRNPQWWEQNFSILGTTRDLSGLSFNVTVILAGAAITILADYLTTDLAGWSNGNGSGARSRLAILRWALVAIGVLLACVGIVPVNVSLLFHNFVASSMVVTFVGLVLALRTLLPGFPRPFLVLSYAFLAAIVGAGVMFYPIGYYNLTAFELIASALIFGWLVIFVRNTAAAAADHTDAGAVPAGTLGAGAERKLAAGETGDQ